MKKIRVYFLKAYLFTTTAYNTIQELKTELTKEVGSYIYIPSPKMAGINSKAHRVSNIKNYQFEIVH